MRNLTIAEKQFQVMDATEAGIVAGYVLDDASARHLFQTRLENVGNGLRKTIKEAIEAGKSDAELQAIVTEYDRGYKFSMPGAGARVVDPLEKECRSLAVAAIRAQLSAKGKKYSDVEKEKPEALEAEIQRLAAREDFVKLAKSRLASKRKAGEADLGLDL